MKMFLLWNIARNGRAARKVLHSLYLLLHCISDIWRKKIEKLDFSPIFFSPDCRLERIWVNQMRIRKKEEQYTRFGTENVFAQRGI